MIKNIPTLSLISLKPLEPLFRKARNQTATFAAALCLAGGTLVATSAGANEPGAYSDAAMAPSQVAVLEPAPEPSESTPLRETAPQLSEPTLVPDPAPAVDALPDTADFGIDLSMVQDLASIIDETRKQAQVDYLAEKLRKSPQVVQHYVQLAWDEARRRGGLRPELLIAIMHKESTFRPQVQSSYGAQGLMQVVRRWHREKLHASESLFDPVVNVRVGTDILEEYLESAQGDLSKALAKYSGNARGYAKTVLSESRKLEQVADMAVAELTFTPELFLSSSPEQAG